MGKRIFQFLRRVWHMWFDREESEVIKAYKDQVDYLKAMISILQHEREAERVEYKRAMDVLLHKEQLPIIGQYHPEPTQQPFDPAKMLSYMEEEATEKK